MYSVFHIIKVNEMCIVILSFFYSRPVSSRGLNQSSSVSGIISV